MTVDQVFNPVNLSPLGPVPWGAPISELRQGVYVVARTEGPAIRCKPCALHFDDRLTLGLVLNLEYETKRWLPNEPVLYIGRTTRPINTRILEFYQHKVGEKHPHAGGQIVKILKLDRWLYWSHAKDPKEAERKMLSAFERQAGGLPFANGERGKPKRIQSWT